MKAVKTEVHFIKLELEMSPAEADALRTILGEYRRFPKAMPAPGAQSEDNMTDKVIDAIAKAIGRVF